jgi:hypothetical protein
MNHYYGGEAKNLGLVKPLLPTSFASLVKDVLGCPIGLPLTRAQFHALPKRDPSVSRDQDRAKRTNFIIPGVIEGTTERRSGNVSACNLIFLDIDDNDQADRVLVALDVGDCLLSPFNHAVYHTASSTSDKPRLRVVVDADTLSPAHYPAAVSTIARLLGLASVTSESNVVCQPMFMPVLYRDQDPLTDHPLIAAYLDGRAFVMGDIDGLEKLADAPTGASAAAGEADLDHLRAPMEAVSLEDTLEALAALNPDMERKSWIVIGAALKHQFGEAGFDLWRDWSAKGTKFSTEDDIGAQWKSLRETPRGRVPATIRSLFKLATDAGWSPNKVIDRCYQSTDAWIVDGTRTDTELMGDGIKQIAKTPMLSHIQRGALLNRLIDTLKARGIKPSRSAFTKELRAAQTSLNSDSPTDEATANSTPLPAWAFGILYVSQANEFYRHSSGQRWSCDSVNNHFSMCLMTPAEEESGRPAILPQHFLLNKVKIGRVDHYMYDPTQPNVVKFKYDLKEYLNTYRATYPEPDPRQAAVMGKAILDHTRLLFGSGREGTLLIDWMAYQVQNPGTKILWAPFIQGAEGCGKTLYAVVMRAVLGETNVKEVAPNVVLNSDWNEWASDTQLVVFEEIRVAGESRHAVMNKIKPLITNSTISINQRNKDTRTVPNFANYFIASNYQDALAINENDRRYFVLFAEQQTREQVAAIGQAYYHGLYELIRANAAGLRSFLLDWPITDEFNPMQCPQTRFKSGMVEAASTPLQQAVMQELADGVNPLCKSDLVSLKVLRDLIDLEHRGVGKFSDQALASVLRDAGFVSAGRARIGGDRHTLWSRGLSVEMALSTAQLRSDNTESDLL